MFGLVAGSSKIEANSAHPAELELVWSLTELVNNHYNLTVDTMLIFQENAKYLNPL